MVYTNVLTVTSLFLQSESKIEKLQESRSGSRKALADIVNRFFLKKLFIMYNFISQS